MYIVVGIIVGVVLAFIVVSAMKSGLTSVAAKREANSYVIKNSIKIRNTCDNFVRKELQKKERPKQNN